MLDRGPAGSIRELYAAIVAGDIDAVLEHYEQTDELTVFVEGPRWLTRGYDAVATGWRAFGIAPVSLVDIAVIEGPFVVEEGGSAVVAVIVDLTSKADPSATPILVRMRMTHVLRRGDDGRWRTVHEHASQPMPDPYGSGDWLPGAADASR